MAVVIPADSTWLITVDGRVFSQRILATFTYRNTASVNAPTAIDAANTVASAFSNAADTDIFATYLNLMPTNYTAIACRAQVIWPTRTAYGQADFAQAGGWGQLCYAPNLAAAVELVGNQVGRVNHAVKHIGPVPSGTVVDGAFTQAYNTALKAFGAAAITPVLLGGAGTFQPVIFNRAPKPGQNRWIDIIASRLGYGVRTQRRRTLGRGE